MCIQWIEYMSNGEAFKKTETKKKALELGKPNTQRIYKRQEG